MPKTKNEEPEKIDSVANGETLSRSIMRRLWHQLPQIAAAAAIGAAALFFVGWQYKQSLALNFGLSAYPGDMSFQSTVATGVTVFNASNTLVVLGVFWAGMAAIYLVRSIPKFILLWLESVERRAKKLNGIIDKLVEQSETEALGTEQFRSDLRSARRSFRWTNIERAALKLANRSTIPSMVAMFTVSMILTGLSLYLLFQTGNTVAIEDARKIRIEARGPCSGCFVYLPSSKSTGLLGVPVFQSATALYIQEYDGLYQLELSKLEAVKPYLRVSNKPLTSPRR